MQTQVLLDNMSGKTDFIGKPIKAVAYNSHKTNKRSNTIVIHTTNFTGRIWLEGSLKTEPKTDLDWFTIPLTNNTPYIEYSNYNPVLVKRQADYYNVDGSYVWLRVKLDRSYLPLVRSPFAPFDTKSTEYIMSSKVDDATYTHAPYPTSNLNPQYDPAYYENWTPNYTQAYDRRMSLSVLGNVEKIMLCY